MIKSPNQIILCGGKSCCPEINFDDSGNAIVTDDFGGSVKLTEEEVLILTHDLIQRLVANSDVTVEGADCCAGTGCCGQVCSETP
jgi:hypothetical protein